MRPSRNRAILASGLKLLPERVRFRVREGAHAISHPTVGSLPDRREANGVRLEPWKYGASAAVCLSADFELAWASQYVSLDLCRDQAIRTRRFLSGLLETLGKSGIPITWAVVGHLFLEECRRDATTGKAHPEIPHPPAYNNPRWGFAEGDWYQHDPCSSVEADPEWYAPALIDQISRSDVQHEIGCHSFSHTDFSDKVCPPSVADGELRRCREEAGRRGIALKSFVFPGNFEGNHRALKENGFIAYRGTNGPDLSYPERNDGLWNIRESLQLFDPEVDYAIRMPRYLDAAVRTQTACHFSFHPAEVDPSTVERVLVPALQTLSGRARTGEIWIATMSQIASYCEARRSVVVRPTSNHGWEVVWGLEGEGYPKAAISFSVPWAGSAPACEIDGVPIPTPSRGCFVRGERLYLTLNQPDARVAIRSG